MEQKNDNLKEIYLKDLFDAYLMGTLQDKERQELLLNLDSIQIQEFIRQTFEANPEGGELLNGSDAIKKAIIDNWLNQNLKKKGRVLSLKKRLVSMAAVLVFIITGTLLFFNNKNRHTLPVVHKYKNDILPGSNKIYLKLSNGQLIELDNYRNGKIVDQLGTDVLESNGVISYVNFAGNKKVEFNDISTPQSGQIKIELADGTKVWLDGTSSIHFPTSFLGATREVEITGQAYFEVAKNASKPFRIHVKNEVVEVLGTHFNINAHNNENTIKTTLLEGKVKVTKGTNSLLLSPGQQSDGINLIKGANLEETVAWKDGVFSFDGANIKKIMTQVCRWYGAEVKYEDEINEEFVARIKRDVPVSELLNLLESTGQVHFEIEGKTIIVRK